MTNNELGDLIRKAIRAYDGMDAEKRRALLEEHRRPVVFGNLVIDNPNITRSMVDAVADLEDACMVRACPYFGKIAPLEHYCACELC